MSFSKDIKLQRTVLIVGILLMMVKAVAYFITNSNALLTDALESLVNIAAGSFALFSLYYAAQPSDKDHPYGHGKIEFIAGLIEGTLIGIAALAMFGKAIYNFWFPKEISNLDVGIALAVFSGIINFAMGTVMAKKGKLRQSMTLKSAGAHLKSDGYTSLAMIVGLVVVFVTHIFWLDNIIALAMSGYISFVAYHIIRNSIDGVMDKIDPTVLVKVFNVINSKRQPQWIDFHEFRVIQYGRSLHIDCHLVMPFYYTLQQEHVEVLQIEKLIAEDLTQEAEIFIHADPCTYDFCKSCQVPDCSFRKEAYQPKQPKPDL